MTEAHARTLALALPEAASHAHFDREAFRAGKGRVFMTLGRGSANLKLVPDQAAMLIEAEPQVFVSLGGWTRQGYVGVKLDAIDRDRFEVLLRMAWRHAAPKRLAATLVDPDANASD